jgi:hypothetical protein
MDDDRERRLALNEAIAREVNEHVEEVAGSWHADDERIELICECSRDGCAERIHVTTAEYHSVRENELRFMLVDAHVNEEIEHRVGTAGDATVVEKEGSGREVASRTAG